MRQPLFASGLALALIGRATVPGLGSEPHAFVQFRAQFNRAMECRRTNISTGVRTFAAITSDDARGSLLVRGFDVSQLARGKIHAPTFVASIPQISDLQQVYWTRKDDLVLFGVAQYRLVRTANAAHETPAPRTVST